MNYERGCITNLNTCSLSEMDESVLNDIVLKIGEQNRIIGWHDDEYPFGVRIALIHSELSEALEADRKDLMDDHLPHRAGAEVELADAVIRIFDLAYERNLDLAGAIREKHLYNQTRSDHKKENRQKDGGKKY